MPLQVYAPSVWRGIRASNFQRTMESLLQGLPMVCVYIDDIIVSGKTQEEHLHNLNEVLHHLQSAGLLSIFMQI